jgi:Papain-like cysteine protease AvrRpt2
MEEDSMAHSTKSTMLLPVQGYQQTEDYTCGPAAVMSLMRFYSLLADDQMNKKTELQIAQEMGTSKKNGSSPQKMSHWLKTHGFEVKTGVNGTLPMLRQNLSKGIPTLVEWIDWGGHWVIVTGYIVAEKSSHEKDTIIFADPNARYDNQNTQQGLTTFNPDRFEAMWFDAQFIKPGHLVKGVYIIALPKKQINKENEHEKNN